MLKRFCCDSFDLLIVDLTYAIEAISNKGLDDLFDQTKGIDSDSDTDSVL